MNNNKITKNKYLFNKVRNYAEKASNMMEEIKTISTGKKSIFKKTYKSDMIYEGLFDKRSYIDDDGVWHVYPILQTRNPMLQGQIMIICPFCGQLHTHSVYENDFSVIDYTGYKNAHCKNLISEEAFGSIKNGYIIEDPCDIENN